jgi:hypothetical protein
MSVMEVLVVKFDRGACTCRTSCKRARGGAAGVRRAVAGGAMPTIEKPVARRAQPASARGDHPVHARRHIECNRGEP